jgi:alanyl-tRNA synthetase
MNSSEIRRNFLEFFENKKHQIVESAPMVVKNDPTLMFTNAGMNQFKDYFLGNASPTSRRIADTQKCLRVSGKHNDLEEVGIDTYHHTMFEMLGNWSFGDYFKKESIQWAWELLTEVFHLPKERLYVTVFGGDSSEKLDFDKEAFDFWKEYVSEERILNGSKKDNFWEMGDSGPCGPCSEIHIDLRTQEEIDKVPGKDLVNNDHPQVIEIWNLVFIQFNRLTSGALEQLPEKHVDTGMGFERLVRAIEGKASNYDTDVFKPMINFLEKESRLIYGETEQTDIAMRVISDHIRAISFAIADGQLPSNVKAGYVIRRILRRAVRYGFTFLNFKDPFLYKLVAVLAKQMGKVFPELHSQQDFISKVIQEEESSFLRTLENGLKRFDEEKQRLNAAGKVIIPGDFAFELYDTFGFPIDLTQLLARESDLKVDMEGFSVNMQKQKERSRAAATQETGDWTFVHEDEDVEFVGYDSLEAQSLIVKYRTVKEKNKTLYQIVLDKTPFYAESGGQVGDTGYLQYNGEKIPVVDTKKENELIVHYITQLPKDTKSRFISVVDTEKRNLTQNNHSATHLLHAALRDILGTHVQQKGSLVNDEILRFDFSHFTKVTDEEIQKIENIVNERIRQNIYLDEKRNVPIEEAKKLGATALFGEKYGNFVRVITFDKDFSVELCGGTHVRATGQIGFFKIISESSVAAGVRRIEAITARAAEVYVRDNLNLLEEIRTALKNPKDIKQTIESLISDKVRLEKNLESLQMEKAGELKRTLANKVQKYNDTSVIIEKVELPNADVLKKIAFDLRNQIDSLFLVLAAEIEGKPQVAVMVSDNLVSEKNINAGNIVRELAKEIKGGGGGQPFFATAGGKEISGLDNVVTKAREMIGSLIK